MNIKNTSLWWLKKIIKIVQKMKQKLYNICELLYKFWFNCKILANWNRIDFQKDFLNCAKKLTVLYNFCIVCTIFVVFVQFLKLYNLSQTEQTVQKLYKKPWLFKMSKLCWNSRLEVAQFSDKTCELMLIRVKKCTEILN